MFPKDMRLEIFSFFNEQEAQVLAQTCKTFNTDLNEKYTIKLEKEFNCKPPFKINPISYYRKLNEEKKRLIDYVTLQEIWHDFAKKDSDFEESIFFDFLGTETDIIRNQLKEWIDKYQIKQAYLSSKKAVCEELLKDFIIHPSPKLPTLDNNGLDFVFIAYLFQNYFASHPFRPEKIYQPTREIIQGMEAVFNYTRETEKEMMDFPRVLLKLVKSLAKIGAEELLRLSLTCHPDLIKCQFSTKMDCTLLLSAVSTARLNIVRLLLEAGADVNKCMAVHISSGSMRPIWPAIMLALLKLCQLDDVPTPAAIIKHKEIIELLLSHGADINQEVNEEWQRGRVRTIRQICEDLYSSESDEINEFSVEKKEIFKFILDFQKENSHEQRLSHSI